MVRLMMKPVICVLVTVLSFGCLFPLPASAALRGDFSNNGALTTDDVVLLLAWIQCGRSNNGTLMLSVARELMPSLAAPLAFFPALAEDDYNQDGFVTTDDVVLFLAWIQTGKSSNVSLITSLALELMSTVKGEMKVFPGATLSGSVTTNTAVDTGTGTGTGSSTGTGTGTGSTINISITGIVPNP